MALPRRCKKRESEIDDSPWVEVPQSSDDEQSLPDRVRRVQADLADLNTYYNISIAPRRHKRLAAYYDQELKALFALKFDKLSQQHRVDFILLRNFLRRKDRQLALEQKAQARYKALIPFAVDIVSLCEARQDVKPMKADRMAQQLADIKTTIADVQQKVKTGKMNVSKTDAYKGAKVIAELRSQLAEFYGFYHGYDPNFDFWATKPWAEADAALEAYLAVVQDELVGINSGSADDIVGEPIGRDGLMVELEAEMIAYSPESLLELAEEQYRWCEKQMKAASNELGFGDDWKKAREYVKEQFVPPGEQTQLVRALAREGNAFIEDHDLISLPDIANETIPMFMIPPEQQKQSPFFLGGEAILVSYPTADMAQPLKRMVMRGNNRHFSRATVFHELIPGHRLQLFMGERHHSHRQMFMTPFFVEGWAMYWELVFWNRGDFFVSPEDRIGTMFWRMHRCARIIFSLKFHLGQMTPQECVDMLVDWVGHERSTAEGEVRRSFAGDYPPLYQAGYMLGALQIYELRKEALDGGHLKEKEFHDRVLRANTMPIELLRALVLGKELTPEYEAKWRFYD